MKNRFETLREQLDCLVHGHRLSGAPVYAAVLPDGQKDEELHYCEACGTPVWLYPPHEAPGLLQWTDETAL